MFLLGNRDPVWIFSLTHVLEQQPHSTGSFFLRHKYKRLFKGHILFFPSLLPSFPSLEPNFVQTPTQFPEFSTKLKEPYSFLVSSEGLVSPFPSVSGSFGCSASLDAAGRVSGSCSSPTEADSSEVTSASKET